MAARLNPRHQEMVREKIRASQLINFIQNYALGIGKDQPGYQEAGVRIKAALGLLAKCIPDMQRTELTGKDGERLSVEWPLPKSALDQ